MNSKKVPLLTEKAVSVHFTFKHALILFTIWCNTRLIIVGSQLKLLKVHVSAFLLALFYLHTSMPHKSEQ